MRNKESLLHKLVKFWNYKKSFVDFLIVPLVFFIVAFCIFNKFSKFNFIYDDIDYLAGLKGLIDTRGDYFGYIRTMAMRPFCFKPVSLGVNWIVNYKLFGLNPHSYHLYNIIVHSINSCLVYFLIRISCKLRLLGFVISFCYLVHPFNVEGMVWISGGFTSQIVVLFSCLTLSAYYVYLKKFNKNFIILSYLSFTCAFLSREDVIMLPFLMVFFLFFLGCWQRARIKELIGYLVIIIFVLAVRYWLLYPSAFEAYRWDFTNIQNAFFRNNYYMNLALSPLKSIFGKVNFLEQHKILSLLFRILCLLLFPFTFYKIYQYRKTMEVKLLGFGLAWYALFSVPFNFMFGKEFLCDRYLSLSIIGILMAQIAVIAVILKGILRNHIYIKLLLLYFSFIILFICNYMIIERFNDNGAIKSSMNIQYYSATINMAIKNNPNIKNIILAGFPEEERFLHILRLYTVYKNKNSIDMKNEEKGEKGNENTLVIQYKDIIWN
ncbi:MAG: glycosyltransferase family 39 protein [Candidatus Omnitrophica bacterium]|nr:glycosyltransferase family 39 protein [Candidatus Omnitrophota bacterium]